MSECQRNAFIGLRFLTLKPADNSVVETDGNEHLLWCFAVETQSALGEKSLLFSKRETGACVSNWLDSSVIFLIPSVASDHDKQPI